MINAPKHDFPREINPQKSFQPSNIQTNEPDFFIPDYDNIENEAYPYEYYMHNQPMLSPKSTKPSPFEAMETLHDSATKIHHEDHAGKYNMNHLPDLTSSLKHELVDFFPAHNKAMKTVELIGMPEYQVPIPVHHNRQNYHLLPNPMSDIQQSISENQLFLPHKDVSTSQLSQAPPSIHTHQFYVNSPPPYNMIKEHITQNELFEHPQPVLIPSHENAERENMAEAKISISSDMHSKVDLSTENHSSNAHRVQKLLEYNSIVAKLYEVARAATILSNSPQTQINFDIGISETELWIYVCILKELKTHTTPRERSARICCKNHTHSQMKDMDFYALCDEFGKIVNAIPAEEKSKIKKTFPRKNIPKVTKWIVKKYE